MILYNPAFRRSYKNIIFDFDGTINNTEPGIASTFKKVLDIYKIDYTNVDFREHIGPPLEYSFQRLVGGEKWQEALQLYRKIFAETNAGELCSLYDGIVDVLTELKKRNFTLAVATSKYEPFAKQSIKKFNIGSFFCEVYGQTETRGFKTEILQQLIADRNWNKDECLMIGDTHYDIVGARENGIAVLAVSYGFESRQSLLELNPDALVDSPYELIEAIVKKENLG